MIVLGFRKQHDIYADSVVCTGWVWIASLARLMMYSALLSPGFALMALFYFFSNRVHRNIWYGRMVRHKIDNSAVPYFLCMPTML
jgi:hypothetical protein